MESLKKKFFAQQKSQELCYSFNNIVSISAPVNVDTVYSTNVLNNRSSYLLIKSDELEEDKCPQNYIKISFLFFIKIYSTYAFRKNQKYPSFKNASNLDNKFQSVPNPKKLETLFCGCVLKKVKGGFILDLNGFICFMPYSLSEGSRFAPYEPQLSAIQLFKSHGLSLVSLFDKEIFFNLIASRNTFLLKKALKFFIGYSFNSRNFLIRKKINLKVKNKTVRLLGFSLKNESSFRLKLIKETFTADVFC